MIHDPYDQSMTCDECDYEDSFPAGSDASIESYAKAEGWDIDEENGVHLCSDCGAKKDVEE